MKIDSHTLIVGQAVVRGSTDTHLTVQADKGGVVLDVTAYRFGRDQMTLTREAAEALATLLINVLEASR